MNRQLHALTEAFAVGLFAISVILTALRTQTPWGRLHTDRVSFDPWSDALYGSAYDRFVDGSNLLGVISQPANPVLWSLLGAVVIAALVHLIARLHLRDAPAAPMTHTAGLILSAVWPWLLNPAPLAGLALAWLSLALLIHGIARCRRAGHGIGQLAVAFVAGWLLIAASSALGMVLHREWGLGLERSVLLGLLLSALAGVWVQLRIESHATFSLAIIWAMIGFAAATAGSSITIATACVLGISALAVVMVRVTT